MLGSTAERAPSCARTRQGRLPGGWGEGRGKGQYLNWNMKISVFADKKGSLLGLPVQREAQETQEMVGELETAYNSVMSEEEMSGYREEMRDWPAAWHTASWAKDLDLTLSETWSHYRSLNRGVELGQGQWWWSE